MTRVTGDLKIITGTAEAATEVRVRSKVSRPVSGGWLMDMSDRRPVFDGKVDLELLPGACVLVAISGGLPSEAVDLIVPESGTASLEACIRAAEAAGDLERDALDELRRDFGAWVDEVRASLGSAADSAQSAASSASAAKSSASKAASSAKAAAGSASAADKSRSDASAFANSAKSASEQATASAQQAAGYMDAASEAESKATISADVAGSFATSAASNADRAKSSADSASTSASGAKGSADAAKRSADAAGKSASAAKAGADRVGTAEQVGRWADTAQASADSATESAASASTSAESAKSSAAAAASSAEKAEKGTAETAANASAASAFADSAKTSAGQAEGSASAAKADAGKAATSATSAKSDADRAANIASSTSWDGDKLTVNGQTSPPLKGEKGDKGDPGESPFDTQAIVLEFLDVDDHETWWELPSYYTGSELIVHCGQDYQYPGNWDYRGTRTYRFRRIKETKDYPDYVSNGYLYAVKYTDAERLMEAAQKLAIGEDGEFDESRLKEGVVAEVPSVRMDVATMWEGDTAAFTLPEGFAGLTGFAFLRDV